jgi:Cryptococcal mannosyltransferase 1
VRMSKALLPFTSAVRFMRSPRRRRVRIYLLVLFVALGYLFIILPIQLHTQHRRQLAAYDISIAHLPNPRVFIAASLAHCATLLSKHWIPSLLELVDKLGHENVFVSILENGSLDGTQDLLVELQHNLTQRRVAYSIRFEEGFRDGTKFEKDGLLTRLLGKEGTRDNWILTESGWFPRRISYLAGLRNLALDPLKNSSVRYDKILFVNDVIFSV